GARAGTEEERLVHPLELHFRRRPFRDRDDVIGRREDLRGQRAGRWPCFSVRHDERTAFLADANDLHTVPRTRPRTQTNSCDAFLVEVDARSDARAGMLLPERIPLAGAASTHLFRGLDAAFLPLIERSHRKTRL